MTARRRFTRAARIAAAVLAAWLTAALLAAPSHGQLRYPGGSWDKAASPEQLGWSADKLRAAREYAATIKTAAVVIVVDGTVLDEWGETARRFTTRTGAIT